MFIAEDGLVLRAVVLEHPADVLHMGTEHQIAHEDDDTHHAFQQVAQPHGQGNGQAHQSGEGGGQQDEQPHGENDAQHHRHGDKKGGGLLAAQVSVQPELEPGGLLRLLLVLREKGSRVHQRLDAVGQGGAEIEDTPEQRQAQGGVLVLDEHPLLHLLLQPAVRLAHHNGLLLRSQHHDPLNECLSADHGLVGCGAGLLCFIWHSYTVLLN